MNYIVDLYRQGFTGLKGWLLVGPAGSGSRWHFDPWSTAAWRLEPHRPGPWHTLTAAEEFALRGPKALGLPSAPRGAAQGVGAAPGRPTGTEALLPSATGAQPGGGAQESSWNRDMM